MAKKILVVDDDEQLVEMMKIRLEANNYEVITACDGNEGLQQAKENKPDLIILDIVMPRMDGNVMATALKEDAETAEIPIIFLTCLASGIADPADSSIISASNIVLAKPFEADKLLSVINGFFAK